MSQWAAGDRARWCAAVLIVAGIAATSMVVQLWPVERPTPPLASRAIPLYQAPATPQSASAVLSAGLYLATDAGGGLTDLEAEGPAVETVPLVQIDSARTDSVLPDDAVNAATPSPQDITVAEALRVAGVTELPREEPERATPAAVLASAESPRVEDAEAPLPVAASPRGFVEAPAVAVTRAVTIAGRGIMTGLRATSAILRAPF